MLGSYARVLPLGSALIESTAHLFWGFSVMSEVAHWYARHYWLGRPLNTWGRPCSRNLGHYLLTFGDKIKSVFTWVSQCAWQKTVGVPNERWPLTWSGLQSASWMILWGALQDQAIELRSDLLNWVILNQIRNGARPENSDYLPYENLESFKKSIRSNEPNRFVLLEMKRVIEFGYKIKTIFRKENASCTPLVGCTSHTPPIK